jgi:MYXO-CTERM domain-containing protein
VPYAQAISGLSANTTYYFCAIAQNAVDTSFGTVLSFTTPSAPTVTTGAAAMVTSTMATLNGSANPNLASASGWFRYSAVSPGSCDDSFGTRAPSTGGTALGAGSSAVPYLELIGGLLPNTTYYYCAIAQNAEGTGFGAVLSFTTAPPEAPVVTTEAATAIASDGATLNGTANPGGAASTGWFRYSDIDPINCDDTFGTRAPASGGDDLGAGLSAVNFDEVINGLIPATTYYYCAIADNASGVSFGDVLSFTTAPAAPIVTTNPPTNVDIDAADLNGSAIPNGADTTAWFRYSATDPGACDDTFGTATATIALGAGLLDVPFGDTVTGLSPTMTYYYCAIAENAEGIAFGQIVSFSPAAVAPVVTTEPATDITGVAATLEGSANPNALVTTGWFRYGATDPGDCSDAFGERAPLNGGVDIGSGQSALLFSVPVSGLEPSTTYYYCAAAENLGGATFGEVLTFTTEAVPPLVTTVSAELDDLGVMIFSGEANPRGAEAIGWFRYGSDDPGSCNDEYGTRVPAADGTALGDGKVNVPFTEALDDLAPGTYYLCAVASNEAGTAVGGALQFVVVDDGVDAPKAEPAEDTGCGCRVVGSRSDDEPLLGLGMLLLLAFGLRRRRR